MMFGILDKDNAEAFFDLYMSRKEAVLADFKQEVEAGGGPAAHTLDHSPESLLSLWTWLRPRMKWTTESPLKTELSPWYASEMIRDILRVNDNAYPAYHLTPETTRLADGFIYYYGDVHVQNLEGMQWKIGKETPYTMRTYRPCVAGKYFSTAPIRMVIDAIRATKDPTHPHNSDDAHYRIFQRHKADYDATKAWHHAHNDFSLEEAPPKRARLVTVAPREFEELNKYNAQLFFDIYMGRKESALTSFKQEVAAGGGPAIDVLDNSPESLIPLWTWLRPRLKYTYEDPPAELMPIWYAPEFVYNHGRDRSLEVETARLLDGFIYYYGDVHVQNLEGVQWRIGKAKPLTIGSYHPCISGKYFGTYPLWMVMVAMSIAQDPDDERNTEDSQYKVFGYHQRDYESAKAYYHARGDFSLEEVPPVAKTRKKLIDKS